MLYDAYGVAIRLRVNHEIDKRIMEVTQRVYKDLLTEYFSKEDKIDRILFSPKVLNKFGDRITREDAGLGPVPGYTGGKNIVVPLNYKEVSVPITIEDTDETT